MPSQNYEVVVTRKLTNRFVVRARSGTEAAMQIGQILAGTDPWGQSDETELSRQMRAPSVVAAADAAEPVEPPPALDLG